MVDLIIKDVRDARGQIARRFDFDLHALFSDVRERQKSLGRRLVPKTPPNQPEQTTSEATGA